MRGGIANPAERGIARKLMFFCSYVYFEPRIARKSLFFCSYVYVELRIARKSFIAFGLHKICEIGLKCVILQCQND